MESLLGNCARLDGGSSGARRPVMRATVVIILVAGAKIDGVSFMSRTLIWSTMTACACVYLKPRRCVCVCALGEILGAEKFPRTWTLNERARVRSLTTSLCHRHKCRNIYQEKKKKQLHGMPYQVSDNSNERKKKKITRKHGNRWTDVG